VGSTDYYVNISNCSAEAGGFDITKTGTGTLFYAGGFIGDFWGSSEVKACYAVSPIVVNNESTDTAGDVIAGGFFGRSQGGISYCYAAGSVSALGSSIFAGGFGGLVLNSTVSYCYAAGNVTAVVKGGVSNYIGGFLGYSNSSVSNCYALGNVFFDKPAGDATIRAGGLVGEFNGSAGVNQCFALGSVTAQRGASGAINIGGLVGNKRNRPITNSAALGTSLTATGPGTQTIGRVYGGSTGGTITNNHGYNGMRLYGSDAYGDGRPAEVTPLPTSDATGKDGKDAHGGIFRSRTFWTGATAADGSGGLGFSIANWSLTTVESLGHPVLLDGVNGRIMGGQ
jgi:hypothetical protein